MLSKKLRFWLNVSYFSAETRRNNLHRKCIGEFWKWQAKRGDQTQSQRKLTIFFFVSHLLHPQTWQFPSLLSMEAPKPIPKDLTSFPSGNCASSANRAPDPIAFTAMQITDNQSPRNFIIQKRAQGRHGNRFGASFPSWNPFSLPGDLNIAAYIGVGWIHASDKVIRLLAIRLLLVRTMQRPTASPFWKI